MHKKVGLFFYYSCVLNEYYFAEQVFIWHLGNPMTSTPTHRIELCFLLHVQINSSILHNFLEKLAFQSIRTNSSMKINIILANNTKWFIIVDVFWVYRLPSTPNAFFLHIIRPSQRHFNTGVLMNLDV